jgi:hypothetical protein
VLAVAFSVLVGVWLGSTGTSNRTPSGTVAIKLVDGGDATPTDSTTTTDPGATGGTPTATVPAPPAAPNGYADQLSSLYSAVYAVSTAVPDSLAPTSVESPDQFNQQLSTATPDDLGYLAQAVPVATVDSISNALAQAQPVEDSLATSLNVHVVRGSSTVSSHSVRVAPRDIEANNPTLIPSQMPTTGSYVGDVSGNTYTATCPAGAPSINASDIYGEGDIFALQIAIDVVSGAYNGLSPGAGTDSPVGIGFFITAAVLAVVGLALQVAQDTLSYFQTVAGDCQEAQMQQVGIDTDNTTYQTYTLLSDVAGTVNEIDSNVAALAAQDQDEFDQQLTLDIEQALSAPIGTVPMSSLELPVMYEGLTLGGYLDSTPVGVNEVVDSTIANMQATGQTMSPQATRDQSLAEQALAAGMFKLAFDYFRMAYQAAAG